VPEPDRPTVPVAVPVVLSWMPLVEKPVTDSLNVTVYVTGPDLVRLVDGAPTLTVGAVLSTVNVVLAELAVFWLPAESAAALAVTVMPSVPSPVVLEMVTV